MSEEYKLSPIGHVRVQNGSFALEIAEKYRAGLQELEGFSHINVFWWGHLYDKEEYRVIVECDQPYKKAPPKMGIFATRSPVRPNPVALTTVQPLHIDLDTGIIQVPYIDAEDGTPIVDLKPYHPCEDRIREVSVPKWCDHWPKWYEDSADFDWEAEFTFASS